MSDGGFTLTDRERRWLDVLLILAVVAVGLVTATLVAGLISFFAEPLIIFFLAWLLAFILSPIVSLLVRALPFVPRGIAVLVVYLLLSVLLLGVALLLAQGLASSISTFIAGLPDLQARVPEILSRYDTWLHSLGFQVDIVAVAEGLLGNIGTIAGNLAAPLSSFAVASLGALGNLLIIVFLSLYMVIDRDRLTAFLVRLVPPQYAEEAGLFETSVGRSFGGFLRGQALMGLMYAGVAAIPVFLFGLPFGGVTIAASGVLQAIPFFGPFISWAPPVIVAVLTQPGVAIPTLAIMVAGWLVVMNIVQPRLMAQSVGIHPIVVLGSVIVGAKVAGIIGVVFGIPAAAVISAFFNYYLDRNAADRGTVATRAAQRVASREGRAVRVPEAPPLTGAHSREGSAPSPGLPVEPGEQPEPGERVTTEANPGRVEAPAPGDETQSAEESDAGPTGVTPAHAAEGGAGPPSETPA